MVSFTILKGWPSEYLVLSLGVSSRFRDFSTPIMDKCKSRLATWKANYLSFAGRVTLMKATLSNLPICHLSLFKNPKGVAFEIEKIQISFLGRDKKEINPLIGLDYSFLS